MEQIQNDSSHKFKLQEFEGPLDLLLFLIRKSEINIYDIPIAEIVEQYLSYLEYAAKKNLDNLSEFYIMASTLLYIKSKMLLPVEVNVEDEFDDPRTELVERLIEYQKFKKISDLMTVKEKESEWIIERSKKQRNFSFVDDREMWEEVDVWDLLQTFSDILGSLSNEQIIDFYEEVSINEKLTLMSELLDKNDEIRFNELIVNNSSILEFVCSFLAVLDAVKNKVIQVFQNKMFGDISIKKRVSDKTSAFDNSSIGTDEKSSSYQETREG